MSFTNAWSLIVVLAVTTLAPRNAFAQTANISCPASDNWLSNSKGQNPCLVAAYLEGACVGGQYTIDPLPPNSHYTGPYVSEANGCECNTVTYSLVSACGYCQNSTYEGWSVWATNCSTIYNGSYPMDIPTGTVVPHWAYLDVTATDMFNPAAAQLAGDSPESTATKVVSTGSVVPSSTGISASLTTVPTTSTSSSPAQSSTSASNNSNVGAIAGGVVGGVVVIAAIAGLAAWYIKRRRPNKAPSAAFNDISGGPGYTQSVYSTNPNPFPGQPQMAQQPRLYDPSDPSTFPVSPPSPTIQTTSSANIYQNPSQLYAQQRPGQYSGAPEV